MRDAAFARDAFGRVRRCDRGRPRSVRARWRTLERERRRQNLNRRRRRDRFASSRLLQCAIQQIQRAVELGGFDRERRRDHDHFTVAAGLHGQQATLQSANRRGGRSLAVAQFDSPECAAAADGARAAGVRATRASAVRSARRASARTRRRRGVPSRRDWRVPLRKPSGCRDTWTYGVLPPSNAATHSSRRRCQQLQRAESRRRALCRGTADRAARLHAATRTTCRFGRSRCRSHRR